MSKGDRRGNKETKKAKKKVPDKPVLPTGAPVPLGRLARSA
jgi:hypothetical protein